MKICCFTETFLPTVGGAETVLHQLATRLTDSGESIHVLAPRVRGVDNSLSTPYCVHRYGKPSSKRWAVRQNLLQLTWLHLRHRFDLLHCHSGYPAGYVGASFKRLFKLPMVVRPHGSDILPGERIRRHPRLELRLKQSLAASDAVVAQGRFLRKLIRSLGVADNRIHIIHNGADLNAFAAAGRFDHPRPYILAVGSLIHRKGFDLLLRAYARLRDPKLDLLIAGSGREGAALQRLARELAPQGTIRFLGSVTGPVKVGLYRSADFLVCPSREEPFANVILEAFAAGLPVIASAVGGNTELVTHASNGLLFEREDVFALTAAIERMSADDDLMARLRRGVSARVAAFDWPIIAAQYADLYRFLIDSHRKQTRLRNHPAAPR